MPDVYTLLICPVCGAAVFRDEAPTHAPYCDGEKADGSQLISLREPHHREPMVPVAIDTLGGRRRDALDAAAERTKPEDGP